MHDVLKQVMVTIGVWSVVAVGLAGILTATPAVAHTSGASIEQTVDGYLIDVGYSPEEPLSGDQTRFDFLLYDAETGEEVPFTDIWFRIENGKQLLFAGGLAKAEFGTTGMTFSFPSAGSYTGFVRFSNEEGAVVETSFTLQVQQGDASNGGAFSLVALGIGILAGVTLALVGVALVRRMRQKTGDKTEHTPPEKKVVDRSEPAKNTSLMNLIVSVLIGLACAGGAFYVTMTLLSDDELNASTSKQSTQQTSPVQSGTVEVVLTDEGFEPSTVTITRGTTIEFSTTAGRPFWPASNLHPTHEIYPAFDPLEPIPPEETWSFTFDQIGKWNMHDHIRSYFTGTINVVEE